MTFLETKRLQIERLSEEHFYSFSSCLSEPGILRDSFGQFSDQQIREIFDRNLEHWSKHGFGQGSGFLKASQEPAGIYGIKYVQIEGKEYSDPGALTRLKFQKTGLAREAMIAVLSHGFNILGFEKITTVPSSKNKISIGFVEKLGFKFVRTVQRVAGGVALNNERLYELSKENWNRV